MGVNINTKKLFDGHGRRIPFDGMRVFSEAPMFYYKLNQPKTDFGKILSNSQQFADIDLNITVESFESVCMGLKTRVQNEPLIGNLFSGVHFPFICPKVSLEEDMGTELEKITLPSVASSFKSAYPNLHCKATLQGGSQLSGELSVATDSRYEGFLEARRDGAVAGWYFPQALQGYDIESQRSQMKTLPLHEGLTLSGGSDVAAALVGSPDLLVNENDYPPVLCLSALKHADERLMLCFKDYGKHLEFWCMSQMLTPELTQVSEQWSGGLTLYAHID